MNWWNNKPTPQTPEQRISSQIWSDEEQRYWFDTRSRKEKVRDWCWQVFKRFIIPSIGLAIFLAIFFLGGFLMDWLFRDIYKNSWSNSSLPATVGMVIFSLALSWLLGGLSEGKDWRLFLITWLKWLVIACALATTCLMFYARLKTSF